MLLLCSISYYLTLYSSGKITYCIVLLASAPNVQSVPIPEDQ